MMGQLNGGLRLTMGMVVITQWVLVLLLSTMRMLTSNTVPLDTSGIEEV